MTGPNTHTITLKIDAQSAKAGAREFNGALASIKKAMQDLERSSNGAFKNVGTAPQAATASLDAVARTATSATVRIEQQSKRMAAAVSNSLTTAGSQAAKLSAAFSAIGDDAGLDHVTQALHRFKAAAANAGNGADLGLAKADFRAEVAGLKELAGEQQSASAAAAAHAKSLHDLKTKFDPIYAASSVYEKQLTELNSAFSAGVLSSAQYDNALERLNAQLEMGVVSSNKWGQSVRVSSAHMAAATTNVVNQFNDIGVMLAAGQSPLLLALQQGTQLSQVFTQMSAGGASPLAMVRAGLAGMLNPISLITIGSIAMGAALIQGIGKVIPQAADFEESLESASKAIQNARAAGDAMSFSVMVREYGDATKAVRELLGGKRELALFDAQQALDATQSALGGIQTFVDPRSLLNFARAMQLTREEAKGLKADLQTAMVSRDPVAYADALADMRRQLSAAAGGAENLTGSAGDLYKQLLDSEDVARKFIALDLGNGIRPAVDAASQLSEELGISLGLARQIAQSRQTPESTVTGFETNDPRNPNSKGRWTGGFGSSWEGRPNVATASRSGNRASGGGVVQSELERTTRLLQEQHVAYTALSQGIVETDAAARLLASAQLDGTLDSATLSAIKSADAIASANEQLAEIVRNAGSGNLGQTAGEGLKDGLSQALQQAANGDVQSFAATIANTVQSRMAAALADKLVNNLGIDKLFDIGATTQTAAMTTAATTSGATIAASMTAAGATVAGQLATAIATGTATGTAAQAAGATGSGFLSLLGFREGGISDRPSAVNRGFSMSPAIFANAPHYAEGTANTSGIPAVLHPNEAVVPLSRGRKIPIEGGMGGGSVSIGEVKTTVNVESSGDTDAAQAQRIAAAVNESVRNMIVEEIALATAYGNALNPRGGF